ncbi:MAG: hypothetical protein KDI46_06510 [Alphaproteobacteria bacterium]|nr:hypothetical protein [Alphaproteobacteria bacterium]
MDPDFAPAGYTYHKGAYENSPPGSPAKSIGYDYERSSNDAAMQRWDHAVKDLLLKGRSQGLLLPSRLYLVTDMKPGAFQSSYDVVLRDNLNTYDHVFVDRAEDADAVLFYSAYDQDDLDRGHDYPAHMYNDDLASPYTGDGAYLPSSAPLELVLGVVENSTLKSPVRGSYTLPLHGYIPDYYVDGSDNPLKQKSIFKNDFKHLLCDCEQNGARGKGQCKDHAKGPCTGECGGQCKGQCQKPCDCQSKPCSCKDKPCPHAKDSASMKTCDEKTKHAEVP